MQQRYYDPMIGRFLSVDPVAASLGSNFNRYSYASNNPYKFVDPDGRQAAVRMTSDAAERERKKLQEQVMALGANEPRSDGESSAQDHADAYWANAFSGDWKGALNEGMSFIAESWREAYSSPESGILTTMSIIPFVGAETGAARAGVRAIPMGSSRSPMRIPGQQNVPTNIGGRQYTGHALDSMQSPRNYSLCRRGHIGARATNTRS
jgi:hypothetical protein